MINIIRYIYINIWYNVMNATNQTTSMQRQPFLFLPLYDIGILWVWSLYGISRWFVMDEILVKWWHRTTKKEPEIARESLTESICWDDHQRISCWYFWNCVDRTPSLRYPCTQGKVQFKQVLYVVPRPLMICFSSRLFFSAAFVSKAELYSQLLKPSIKVRAGSGKVPCIWSNFTKPFRYLKCMYSPI